MLQSNDTNCIYSCLKCQIYQIQLSENSYYFYKHVLPNQIAILFTKKFKKGEIIFLINIIGVVVYFYQHVGVAHKCVDKSDGKILTQPLNL